MKLLDSVPVTLLVIGCIAGATLMLTLPMQKAEAQTGKHVSGATRLVGLANEEEMYRFEDAEHKVVCYYGSRSNMSCVKK